MPRRSIKAPPPEEQPFPVRGYVLINLLFYAFLILAYAVAYWMQKRQVTGLVPVLLGLGVLFSLVTLYDAAFDRIVFQMSKEKKREATPAIDTAAGDGATPLPLAPDGAAPGEPGDRHPKP